ncbi:MAG: hypothetical protein K2L42_05865 [Clostridia bacterium]|nr:hypothetical protein [Clostridia bacterium]
MKRIKILLSALISVLFCFALAGCSNRDGKYFPDSLDYKFSVYEYINEIDVSYSFEVTTPDFVQYEVEYTFSVYNNKTKINSENKKYTLSPSTDITRTVTGYADFSYTVSTIQERNLRAEITDVTITPKEAADEYQSYAIGFGTAGGAVLIACTALFIVFKVKENK